LALCPAPINRKDDGTAVVVRRIRFFPNPTSEGVVVTIIGKGGASVGFLSRIVRSVYASAGCIRCSGRHLSHQAHDIDNEGMAVSG